MDLSIKRFMRYGILLLIGLSITFYGLIGLINEASLRDHTLTDEEVIARARTLGMIKLEEVIKEEE